MEKILPDILYIQAFKQYCGAQEADIKIRRLDGHAHIFYRNNNYLVSHESDFESDIRSYFERDSYNEIYTQTFPLMWDSLIKENEIPLRNWVLNIYKEWVKFWELQKEAIKGGEARYQKFKDRAWQELQIFLKAIELDKSEIINTAEQINELELLPLVAMAVKENYNDFELFLQDCVGFHIEYGPDFITSGEVFEVIILLDDNREEQYFYVYNTEIEYDSTE